MKGTPRPPFRNIWTLESLSPGDVSELLGVAARLERWPGAQTAARPLAGRNLAVIGGDAANAPIRFVRDAAGELGGNVHRRGDRLRLHGRDPDEAQQEDERPPHG